METKKTKKAKFASVVLAAVATTLLTAATPASLPTIPLAAASAVFERAHALCSADDGRLWGISLCGPLMLVDPRTHAAIANVHIAGAEQTGAYYRFTLPVDAPIANAPFEYAGIRWAQVIWPLIGTPDEEAVTLMHESFHRIQPKLGFVIRGKEDAAATISGSPVLDTKPGRIWLRGEIHALRVALRSRGAARRRALADALALRAYRQAILPSTVVPEHVLDIIEGLAESTGIDIGLPPARRITYTLQDTTRVENAPSYAREFCYAIGPAYSELLDAADPNWRRGVTMKTSLAALTARTYGIMVSTPSPFRAQEIISRYDGVTIEREEAARAARQAALDAKYRTEFITGRTLRLPMKNFNITFNPQDVEQFDSYGSVYHNLTVSAPWGTIKVSHGDAMIDGKFSTLTVAAPSSLAGSTLRGNAWVLTLSSKTKIVPDAKKPGSYTVGS